MKAFALKHIIISLIILFIAYPFTTFAGEITGSFQNRWKPYANISINGNTVYTVITTGDSYVRIKEKLTDNYLNIEYGSLKSTGIQNGWYSAQWKLIATDSGFYKIQNRWKPDSYIHIEYGNLQSSTIQSGWYSAQWKFTQEVTSSYSLAVTKAGSGYGSVSSNPSGINCGTTCSTKFNANTNITLTATPDSSSIFSGWSGACSGTGSCIVYMNSAKNVTATFTKQTKKKAILLLHGLNSDPNTWKSFASYNLHSSIGQCSVIYKGINQGLLTYNNTGYSDPSLLNCYATKFGAYDSLVGFNGEKCPNGSGCKGDYSTYADLGREVEDSIKYILSQLGVNTEIVLIGHSRGGLAARAYLQGNYQFKDKVKGLITTGTPHSGSKLGRIYSRMLTCNNNSKKSGCDKDKAASDFIQKQTGLNLKAPSVGLLSDLSPDIYNMKTNANLLPKNIKYAEIAYNGQWLGDLWRSGVIWNPLPSVDNSIDNLLGNFSSEAESIILYGTESSGNTTKTDRMNEAQRLQGDGIVDFNSQHLSKLRVSGLDIYTYPIYGSGTVHTGETNQIYDLNRAISDMRSRVGWW